MSYVHEEVTKVIDGEEYRLRIVRDDDAENPRDWDNFGTMVCFHSRYNLGDEHNYSEPRDFLCSILEDVVTEDDLQSFMEKEFEGLEVRQAEDGAWHVANEDFSQSLGYVYGHDDKESAEEEFLELKDEFLDCDWKDVLSIDEILDIAKKYYVMLPLYLFDHSGLSMSTSSFSCRWDSGQVGFIYTTIDKIKAETCYECSTDEEWAEKTREILEGEVETFDQYLTGDVWGFKLEKKVGCECCGNIEWEDEDSCWGFYGTDYEMNGMKHHVDKKFQTMFDEL